LPVLRAGGKQQKLVGEADDSTTHMWKNLLLAENDLDPAKRENKKKVRAIYF